MTNTLNPNYPSFPKEEIDLLCKQMAADSREFNSQALECLSCRVPATPLCAYCNHGLAIK